MKKLKYLIIIIVMIVNIGIGASAMADDTFRTTSGNQWVSGAGYLNNKAVLLDNGDILHETWVRSQESVNIYRYGKVPSGSNNFVSLDSLGIGSAERDMFFVNNPFNNTYTSIRYDTYTPRFRVMRYSTCGTLIYEGTNDYTNSYTRDSVARSNGDIIIAGGSSHMSYATFRAFRISGATRTQLNTWAHGTGNLAHVVLNIGEDKILFAGAGSNWQVLNGNSWQGSGGTAPLNGNHISQLFQRSDGSIVMFGGDSYCIYNSNLSSVIHQGSIGFHSSKATRFYGDYIIIPKTNPIGTNQLDYKILKPNNVITPESSMQIIPSGNTNLYFNAGVMDNNKNFIMFFNGGYNYFLDNTRRCKFLVYTSINSQTQTSVNLSWITSTPGPWDYQIERRVEGSSDWVLIQTQTGQTYTATGLSPGTRYDFRIRATLDGVLTFPYSEIISVRTIPPTPNAPSGVISLKEWHQVVGRGQVVLDWDAVKGATGYRVWVFDGNQYRVFNVGNTTSWNSSVAKIYPDHNWLISQPDNSISDSPFNHVGGGFDLQDNPSLLYRKSIGTTYNSATNYWFRVSAYNESGESPYGNAYMPTLPNATDSQAPICSVTVTSEEGLEKTFDRNVTVNVNAQDSLSGIWKVELSNDGVTYTTVRTLNKNNDNGTGITTHLESFPWTLSPGAGTKTVHVRVTDSVGNQRIVTASIALAEDMLPPSVTLRINNGVESTTSANVTLTLTATDNASTASQMQMRFSNNGVLWSGWEPFTQTKLWDLTNISYGGNTSAEVKKVYVQVADAAQNVGLAFAEIGYNPSPPSGTVSVVGGTAGTWQGRPSLFTNTDAPTLILNYSGVTHVRFDVGLGQFGDWEPYEVNKVVYLTKSRGTCRLRVQVKDAYGVASEPTEHQIVVDGEPPVIVTLRGNAGATAATSSSTILEVIANDNLPGLLQWRYQINGGVWSEWSSLNASTVTVTGLVSGTNRVNVQVKDIAGNVGERSTTIWKVG